VRILIALTREDPKLRKVADFKKSLIEETKIKGKYYEEL